MLQELQGADAPAGREPAGLQRGLQGEAAQEKGAQAEGHSSGRGGHRAGPTEQGADRAVAEGEPYQKCLELLLILLTTTLINLLFVH